MVTTTRKKVTTREGKRIARMRWEQGMSIKDIVKKTGRSSVTVSKFIAKFKPDSSASIKTPNGIRPTHVSFEDLEKELNKKSDSAVLDVLTTAIINLDKAIAEKKDIEARIVLAQAEYDKAKSSFENRYIIS